MSIFVITQTVNTQAVARVNSKLLFYICNLKRDKKMVIAGNLAHKGKTITVYITKDRELVTLDKTETSGVRVLGDITEFRDMVTDLFGAVNLWKVYVDNFKKDRHG